MIKDIEYIITWLYWLSLNLIQLYLPKLSYLFCEQDHVTAQVNVLLALKKQYKELTGKDYVSGTPAAQQPKKGEHCKVDKGKAAINESKQPEKHDKQPTKPTDKKDVSKESEGASREVKKVTRYLHL